MAADQSFLGTGWSFPPVFSQDGADIALVSGQEDIQQSLQILLGTRLGERVLQDDFGCALDTILFEEIDQGLVNSINSLISDAILYHESRITLNDLDVSDREAVQGMLLISIDYTIRSTNSRFNMVYPFYLYEATL
jgi:phage baseplate assembly protein W